MSKYDEAMKLLEEQVGNKDGLISVPIKNTTATNQVTIAVKKRRTSYSILLILNSRPNIIIYHLSKITSKVNLNINLTKVVF